MSRNNSVPRLLFFLLAILLASCASRAQQLIGHDKDNAAPDLSNVAAFFRAHRQSAVDLPFETDEEYSRRMQWWVDAKYGMFIHWGLYSVLAGEYKGETTPRIAEWIQNTLKIPLADYRQLQKEFDATAFDADAWVSLAKSAGMKYVVLTAKHHDGFALFDSAASDYDVMNTPYGKDIVKQLREACVRQGIKFGVYYSHVIDWEHPHAYVGEGKLRQRMNTVDFDPSLMDRRKYLEEKAFPQLVELLTNYGAIDIIWFDMGGGLINNEVRQFAQIARTLQPNIIISSRIGDDVEPTAANREMLFDFFTPSDNYFTGDDLSIQWEMVGTTNGSWGFRKDDHEWRKADQILHSLVSTASRNGNYMLNVGPTGAGQIPPQAADQLRRAGEWLEVNGNAVFGATGSPFPWNYDWGYVTEKPKTLFLSVFNWPENDSIDLSGLLSSVDDVRVLESGEALSFRQDDRQLSIDLSGLQAKDLATVIAVKHNDPNTRIDPLIAQARDGSIRLDRIAGTYIENDEIMSWKFRVETPGDFTIEVISNEKGRHTNPVWTGSEQEGSIQVAGQIIPFTLSRDRQTVSSSLFFYQEITSNAGEINIPRAGTYTLHLKGFEINAGKWAPGLGLSHIRLVRSNIGMAVSRRSQGEQRQKKRAVADFPGQL